MLLRSKLNTLIDRRQATYLTAAVAVAATTLTVATNSGLTNNDYLVIGELGQEGTEVVKIGAAVTVGTSLTVGALVYTHPINTPVYHTPYNQVAFYHSTTTTAPAVGSYITSGRIAIQPDAYYTGFEDTSYTSGYYFIRFYNSTGLNYSDVSSAIPYGGYPAESLYELIKGVRRVLNENGGSDKLIKDEDIIDSLNDKQREIVHDRLWSFAEQTKTLSSVDEQFEYSWATNVNMINSVCFDSQPLGYIDNEQWEIANWDSVQSGDPTRYNIWNGKFRFYPTPSASATTTTLGAAITSETATTVTVTSSSSFQQSPYFRFIIDSEVIYATGSTSTTFTGCLRGQEGTTAATHLLAVTVTERDILYTFQVEPTDLSAMTDETIIPEPEGLCWGVATELALGKLKDNALHDRLKIKYDEWLCGNSARKKKGLVDKYSKKIISPFGRVKDVSETVQGSLSWRDPNDSPSSLTGA